jgi:type VI secretion system secreted protein Hcp
MKEVLVASYHTAGNYNEIVPTVSINLHFTKLEVSYRPQKADGSLEAAVKTGFDFKAHAQV